MKKIVLSLVAIVLLATAFVSGAFAAAVEPKESFTIDYLKNTKNPVVFPHKKHSAENKIECIVCHHKDKSNDDVHKACKECHIKGKENDIPGVGKAINPLMNEKGTKNIFHERCVKCHKEKGGKAPTKCKECHGGGDE